MLSYNTHGLPAWVAGDAPEQRFPKIGALVRAYDVALLQEDFAHHLRLVEGTGDLLVERGNESRFRASALCLLFCEGSGLTFMTRLPRGWLEALESRAYDACSGWLGGANDCLATKGFQHARVLLGGEFEVHFVNTHLDAGRAPEDRAARRAQLEGLRELPGARGRGRSARPRRRPEPRRRGPRRRGAARRVRRGPRPRSTPAPPPRRAAPGSTSTTSTAATAPRCGSRSSKPGRRASSSPRARPSRTTRRSSRACARARLLTRPRRPPSDPPATPAF